MLWALVPKSPDMPSPSPSMTTGRPISPNSCRLQPAARKPIVAAPTTPAGTAPAVCPGCTYHAASTSARAIGGNWVPSIVAGMQLDAVRHLVIDQDSIWPQRQFLPTVAWDILQLIDGVTPVEALITRLSAQQYTPTDVRTGIWHLYVDGLIMLKREDPP